MAELSAIAWTRSTFNPWIGCTKVSPGCDHCYASVSTPARALGVEWGPGKPRRRTSESNWRLPLRWNRTQKIAIDAWHEGLRMVGGDEQELLRRGFVKPEPWRVFCGSLCDVFDNEVPEEWRFDLFDLWAATPHLTWLILTKRIGNAMTMLPWTPGDDSPGCDPLPNVWLGITVVNQAEADRDIPKLLATPAEKRFISYEPALGPVNFHGATVDLIIVGGESDQRGMKARPFSVAWARSTVEQCRAAGVACFVKQLGSQPRGWCANSLLAIDADPVECDNYEAAEQATPCNSSGQRCVYLRDRAGADPAEWPEDLRVREFPR